MDLEHQMKLLQLKHEEAIEAATSVCPELGHYLLKRILAQTMDDFKLGRAQSNLESRSKYIKFFSIYFPRFESLAVVLLFLSSLVFRKKKTVRSIIAFESLTPEQISRNGHLKDLREFTEDIFSRTNNCHESTKEYNLLVKSRKFYKFKKSENAQVIPYVASEIIKNSDLTTRQILIELIKVAKKLNKLVKIHSECELIGMENIIDIVSLKLNLLIPETILCTTPSQLTSLPLLFESSIPSKYMFWYSENSRPISIKIGQEVRNMQLDFLNINNFLHHFVWTESFGKYLEKNYRSEWTAMGPILFYNPDFKFGQEEIDLLIFDVTPFADAKEDEFYSEKNTLNFIRDLVQEARKLDLKTAIKPKRNYTSLHSLNYIEYLEQLENEGKIICVNPNVNLFEIISKAHVVVCIPFTSPALIAKKLKKDVFYYFPNNSLFADINGLEVPLIQGQDQLHFELLKAIKKIRN
jgi:polysaccharide biosynthesis PFTS motif protein